MPEKKTYFKEVADKQGVAIDAPSKYDFTDKTSVIGKIFNGEEDTKKSLTSSVKDLVTKPKLKKWIG